MTEPHIWISPGRQSGAPCIGGTRIPTVTAVRYFNALGMAETLTAYPHLTRPDVLVACWYEAVHKRNRKRWLEWATTNTDALWRGEWDDIADPPHIGQTKP